MVEVLVWLAVAASTFCLGNLIGYETARKKYLAAQLQREMAFQRYLYKDPEPLSELSNAFSNKQKHRIKVYDAEVIE